MPVIHDLICDNCELVLIDVFSTSIGTRCLECRVGRLEIYYGNWGKRNATPLGPSESTVVYEHPTTGKIVYPGRNDTPMPARYAQQGYQRRELRSLREVDRFSEAHGVVNERAHYDSGNSYDSERGRR